MASRSISAAPSSRAASQSRYTASRERPTAAMPSGSPSLDRNASATKASISVPFFNSPALLARRVTGRARKSKPNRCPMRQLAAGRGKDRRRAGSRISAVAGVAIAAAAERSASAGWLE